MATIIRLRGESQWCFAHSNLLCDDVDEIVKSTEMVKEEEDDEEEDQGEDENGEPLTVLSALEEDVPADLVLVILDVVLSFFDRCSSYVRCEEE